MRLLVCGGRDYADTDRVYRTLNSIHSSNIIDVIIEGDARGADRIAGYWAKRNRVDLKLFPADWDKYGKSAGALRNKKMLDEGQPDAVLAFPGGKGTKNMCDQARARGIEIIEIS